MNGTVVVTTFGKIKMSGVSNITFCGQESIIDGFDNNDPLSVDVPPQQASHSPMRMFFRCLRSNGGPMIFGECGLRSPWMRFSIQTILSTFILEISACYFVRVSLSSFLRRW